MNISGNGSEDLHEQMKKTLGSSNNDAAQHNFYTPLNSMDPHQTKPNSEPLPTFKWKIFTLSGLGTDMKDQTDYTGIMNSIARGDYHQLSEKTYHTVDGGIKVFVRWLEYPKKDLKNSKAPTEKEIDAKYDKYIEDVISPKKKKKKTKKTKTKSKKQETLDNYVDPDLEM